MAPSCPPPSLRGWITPPSGGQLFVYAAGTTTPVTVYADVNLTIPLSNPVILDTSGRAIVFLPTGPYKFVLRDANSVTIWITDNIQATQTLQGQIGDIFVFGGDRS